MKHLIALLAAGAMAADAPMVLRLQSGAEAVLTVDQNGNVHVTGARADPLTPQEIEMVGTALRDHPDAFGPNSAGVPEPDLIPPARDAIRFRFFPYDDGSQAVLLIENGTRQSYLYKARIGQGNKVQSTDVCQLVPGARNIEQWQFRVDWIEIGGFEVAPYARGQALVCK